MNSGWAFADLRELGKLVIRQLRDSRYTAMPSEKYVRFVGTVGALANWTIPLTAIFAVANHKDPATINPTLTAVLIVYSGLFVRWSVAIKPPNFPLFLCHVANIGAQSVQLYRSVSYLREQKEAQKIKA